LGWSGELRERSAERLAGDIGSPVSKDYDRENVFSLKLDRVVIKIGKKHTALTFSQLVEQNYNGNGYWGTDSR
jgi:hypothetical protein